MANNADLVAILSLSSFIISSSSSPAGSDNVSGLDAACGPIRLLLLSARALRLFVRPRLPCLHRIRFGRNSPRPDRARLATNAHTIYDSSTQVMPHIEVRNVSLVYDTPAGEVPGVAGVSFNIEASEFLCIVGPSGCGKSTLLNVIAGFLAPTAGEIRIGGKAVSGHGPDRGVVFQDFAQLVPLPTALWKVSFGLQMKRILKTELPVHVPRPRDPLSVEFLDYQKSVLRHLGEDAAAASK